ncbi:hypothetical protein ANAPC5_01426 [Anaplasma phagocytophilum]|nr:hypothetical protein ANAPC5_01426 [Anaplasma phagocytophilum]
MQEARNNRAHFHLLLGGGLFWDILQNTLRKDLVITQERIRFLPVDEDNKVPYNLFIVLGLLSSWKTRMELRHAEPAR